MIKINDTKEKLMDAAIELIWQSSYATVGVADICKRAGVTKGSFYHYFESKAELFYEASHYYWDNMKHELDRVYSPSCPPLEQLENLIQFIIGKQEENQYDENPVSGCPFFTAGGQAGSGDDKVRKAAMEMADNAVKYNSTLMRSLHADNMLQSKPCPVQTGRMIHHYVMGLLTYGRVFRNLEVVKEDLREAIYRIVDLKPEHRVKLVS